MYGLIDSNFSETLQIDMEESRKKFYLHTLSRFLEKLPFLIRYENIENTLIDIDIPKIELLLRQGYNVVIGMTTLGRYNFLGFVNNNFNENNDYSNYYTRPLKKRNIDFRINKKYILDEYLEITDTTYLNKKSNFFVLTNKLYPLVSDMDIIIHRVKIITELEMTKKSLAMQVKFSTIFRDYHDSVDGINLANALYKGFPHLHVSYAFDIEEHVTSIDNSNLLEQFPKIYRAQENEYNELYAHLGMYTLGLSKESGVTNTEALASSAMSKANQDIYLESRNKAFNLFNKKFGTDIRAEYRQESLADMSTKEKVELESTTTEDIKGV